MAAYRAVEGLNVVDFNAVGGIRIQRGDQLLHRRRPAAEVTREIGSEGGAIFRQTEGSGTSKEIEAATGDGHQRHTLAFSHERGPLVGGAISSSIFTSPFQLT